MNKKETYAQHILKSEVGVCVAEEEYVTQDQLDGYEIFVSNVQEKYNLTREEAHNKAQELIKDYQARERAAREKRERTL